MKCWWGIGPRGFRVPLGVDRPGRERGSATVLGLGAILLMLAVLMGFLVLGSAVRASLQARAAADAAALAGAGVLLEGGDVASACAVAGDLSAANGAELLHCVAEDASTATVTARLRVEVMLGVPGVPSLQARAEAHAGAVPGGDAVDGDVVDGDVEGGDPAEG